MKAMRYLILSLSMAYPVLGQGDIQVLKSQIAEKSGLLAITAKGFEARNKEYQDILADYEKTKANRENMEKARANARELYERASQNIDLVSAENLSTLLADYQNADKALKSAQKDEDAVFARMNLAEAGVRELHRRLEGEQIVILGIQARLYDLEMQKPVWAEGYGESILDENKTMVECKRLALEYAKRDAMEKGGKMLVESLTEVENFMLTKDEIKARAAVQIVDQDASGDYGKAVQVVLGDMIKFTAKVRLMVKSVDTYNPYAAKAAGLKGIKTATDEHPSPSEPRADQEASPRTDGILLFEAFDDNRNRWAIWENGESYDSFIENGCYVFESKTILNCSEVIVPPFHKPKNFDIEVVSIWKSGVIKSRYGLILGKDRDTYYTFGTSGNGHAVVGLNIDKLARPEPIDWQLNAARPGNGFTFNQLKIEVRGDRIAYYVNDRLVGRVTNEIVTDPWVVGVMVQDRQKIAFDNLKIISR